MALSPYLSFHSPLFIFQHSSVSPVWWLSISTHFVVFHHAVKNGRRFVTQGSCSLGRPRVIFVFTQLPFKGEGSEFSEKLVAERTDRTQLRESA